MERIETQDIRTIHLTIIIISLLVLILSTKFYLLLPLFFGIFFFLSFVKGASESYGNFRIYESFWNYTFLSSNGINIQGIATFCMIIFGIFTTMWIWPYFTTFLSIFVIVLIVTCIYFFRKYPLKGQGSEIKKFMGFWR